MCDACTYLRVRGTCYNEMGGGGTNRPNVRTQNRRFVVIKEWGGGGGSDKKK